MGMTKFEDENDPGFIAITGELRKWVKDISTHESSGFASTAVSQHQRIQQDRHHGESEPRPSLRSLGSLCTLSTNYDLGDYFSESIKSYSDADCTRISQLLRKMQRSEWSVTPRLYIVLRKIDQLQLLDSFINYGITDLWLPLPRSSLPSSLRPSLHDEFLEAQKTVLTKAVSLENPKLARHAHFGRDDEFPFKEAGRLGEGAFGYVDKVISTLSGREFARKRFRRGGRNQQSKIQLKSFKNELDVLKRIQHSHCVELVSDFVKRR